MIPKGIRRRIVKGGRREGRVWGRRALRSSEYVRTHFIDDDDPDYIFRTWVDRYKNRRVAECLNEDGNEEAEAEAAALFMVEFEKAFAAVERGEPTT